MELSGCIPIQYIFHTFKMGNYYTGIYIQKRNIGTVRSNKRWTQTLPIPMLQPDYFRKVIIKAITTIRSSVSIHTHINTNTLNTHT